MLPLNQFFYLSENPEEDRSFSNKFQLHYQPDQNAIFLKGDFTCADSARSVESAAEIIPIHLKISDSINVYCFITSISLMTIHAMNHLLEVMTSNKQSKSNLTWFIKNHDPEIARTALRLSEKYGIEIQIVKFM